MVSTLVFDKTSNPSAGSGQEINPSIDSTSSLQVNSEQVDPSLLNSPAGEWCEGKGIKIIL